MVWIELTTIEAKLRMCHFIVAVGFSPLFYWLGVIQLELACFGGSVSVLKKIHKFTMQLKLGYFSG